jgi:hypothetical protein
VRLTLFTEDVLWLGVVQAQPDAAPSCDSPRKKKKKPKKAAAKSKAEAEVEAQRLASMAAAEDMRRQAEQEQARRLQELERIRQLEDELLEKRRQVCFDLTSESFHP